MPRIIRRDLPYDGGFVTFGIDSADVSRYLPEWSDRSTPKTDKPVRFVPGGFDVGSFIGSSIVRGPATFSR